MNNGAPATKADLQAAEDRIVETMRDIQTEMLKAFYNYAQSTDLKLKEGELADFTLRAAGDGRGVPPHADREAAQSASQRAG